MKGKNIPNGTAWQQSEIDKLISYGVIKYTDIASISQKLNRSEHSVRNKAISLRIYERNRNARFWTKEELNYLEDYYPTSPTKDIAKHLNRSINSIKAKAQSMGIEIDYNSLITANYIARAIGVCGSTVSDWINKKGLKAKARKRGKTKFYEIEEVDFWKWAENNKGSINWSKVNKNMFVKMPQWAIDYIYDYKTINSRKQYTVREIKTIIAANNRTDKSLAQELGRSIQSIRHIKYKLNKGALAYEG